MNNMLSKLILVLIFFAATAFGHERKNVDDISVLFGGEPEPMVDDERQFLRWKFTDVDTNELITDLEALEAVVTFAGKEAIDDCGLLHELRVRIHHPQYLDNGEF